VPRSLRAGGRQEIPKVKLRRRGGCGLHQIMVASPEKPEGSSLPAGSGRERKECLKDRSCGMLKAKERAFGAIEEGGT
jgi:hypothetical protein